MTARRSTEPVDAMSAADQAYASIIDLILMHKLRPGERTSVKLLADQLGLGRTPIKEAITRLQTEGVLTVVGRSGTTVNVISATEAQQLFSLRRTFEEFAADDIVKHVTKNDLVKLNRLLGEMRASSFNSNDPILSGPNFVRANVAFHLGIIAAARNPFLIRLYAQIQIQAQIVTYLVHRGYDFKAIKKRQQEHEDIVSALVQRNAQLLRKRLRDHAVTSEALILTSLQARSVSAELPRLRTAS